MKDRIVRFDRVEFDTRQNRLRQQMEKQKLDAIIVSAPENIYYLSGYQTKAVFTFQFLLFTVKGPLLLFTRQMEIANAMAAHAEGGFSDYEVYQDDQDPMEAAIAFLRRHLPSGARVGLELASWCMPAQRAQGITRGFTAAKWIDVSALIDRLRLVKSPAELMALAQAGRIGDAIADRTLAAIVPGRTENDLAAVLMTEMVNQGSEYPGSWPNVMVGQRTGRIHAAWEGVAIGRDDHVMAEITGVKLRYHAPSCRTILVGNPLPAIRHAAEVLEKAQQAAVAAVEAGRPARVINQAAEAVLAANDPGCVVARRCGYSLGIGFPPSWGAQWQLGLNSLVEETLETGMAFHIVLVGHLPEGRAVSIGCTVALGENGPERLTRGGVFWADGSKRL